MTIKINKFLILINNDSHIKSPIDFTVEGIMIKVNSVDDPPISNISGPIIVRPEVKVTSLREEQYWNA